MSTIDEVLQQVALGQLDPTEALTALDQAGHRSDPDLRAIKIRTLAHTLEVHADPGVAEALVTSGPAVLQRDGDVLVIGSPTTTRAGRPYAFVDHRTRRAMPRATGACERIVIRVNPAVALDIDTSAVSLRVSGCEGGLRLRLSSSSARLERVSGELDLTAHSSSVRGSVRLSGTSSIRCESSSVTLTLAAGSDVRITADNRMGRVKVPRGGTVGEGRGRLDIDATMGSVTLTNGS
jgi:hypothetical protein